MMHEKCPRCEGELPHRATTESLCQLGLVGPDADRRRMERFAFRDSVYQLLERDGFDRNDSNVTFGRGPGMIGIWRIKIMKPPFLVFRVELAKEIWPYSPEAMAAIEQQITEVINGLS